jgi:hypothetical protein
MHREIPALEIEYPFQYPNEKVFFVIHAPSLPRNKMEMISKKCQALIETAVQHGQVVVLEIYQHLFDFLIAFQEQEQQLEQTKNLVNLLFIEEEKKFMKMNSSIASIGLDETIRFINVPPILGRRAIYFHHIRAPGKRRVISEWAKELQLGGYSKIGYPGVIIVEGHEEYVQEYVRRLQHLRWKQMVVRGEQIDKGKPGQTLDSLRKFHHLGMIELGPNEMSTLATYCREVELEDLFLTTMKIYRTTNTSQDTTTSTTYTTYTTSKKQNKQNNNKQKKKTLTSASS